MAFSEIKAAAVITFFLRQANGTLNDLKLMKLMYFAEREAIRVRNVGIVEDVYFALPRGPVLSATLNLIRDEPAEAGEAESVLRQHVQIDKDWQVTIKDCVEPEAQLSKRELAILQATWDANKDKTKWELVYESHELPEYMDPNGSSHEITFAAILKGLGYEGDALESRLKEWRSYREAV